MIRRELLLFSSDSSDEEVPRKKVYRNRAHKQTRRIVECSIGILKERFPCLNHLRVKPRKAGKIILACITLHNIACTVGRQDMKMHIPKGDAGEDNENGENEPPLAGAVARLNSLLQYFTY